MTPDQLRALADALDSPASGMTMAAAAIYLRAQAEPKRKPLSDERIAEIQRAAYERAAKECESRATAPQGEDYLACYYACADAIRALERK